MPIRIILLLMASLCSATFSTVLPAHPLSAYAAADGYGGFMAGFFHPVLGWDHLLAMLSVGIISAQIGGAAIWRVPLTFVTTMVVGGLLGYLALPFLPMEVGIALSVVFLGAFITLKPHVRTPWAMAFVAFFALFHGYAHGAEMPVLVKPWIYAAGFVFGTALIHIAGVAIGWFMTRSTALAYGLRASGAVIAGAGIWFLMQTLQGATL